MLSIFCATVYFKFKFLTPKYSNSVSTLTAFSHLFWFIAFNYEFSISTFQNDFILFNLLVRIRYIMADYKKLGDLDLYKLIGVEFTATEPEVRNEKKHWKTK